MVARGSVRRVHRGCYAVPGVGREIIAATVFRAEVTCVSAADLYGLTVLDRSDRVHLSVPRPRGTSRPGLRDGDTVVIHREAAPRGQSSPPSLHLPSSSRGVEPPGARGSTDESLARPAARQPIRDQTGTGPADGKDAASRRGSAGPRRATGVRARAGAAVSTAIARS